MRRILGYENGRAVWSESEPAHCHLGGLAGFGAISGWWLQIPDIPPMSAADRAALEASQKRGREGRKR